MRFTPEDLQTFSRVGRQFPEFIEILSRWRTEEMEALLLAAEKDTRTIQGRARLLTELRKQLNARVDP
jgi:hypothetical protein